MQFTSAKNPFLLKIRRAVASGCATEEGSLVIEGPHLLEEALRSNWHVATVLVTPDGRNRHSQILSKSEAPLTEIPARAFQSLAGTETSQEIMALVKPASSNWIDCLRGPGVVVILDGIQDPGNAGAIVRSAEAFGAASLIFLEGCVRVANGKFLRATAGSIFRMPYLENRTRPDLIAHLQTTNIKLYALAAHAATSLSQANLRQPLAIVVGSEASGVSPALRAGAEGLHIPTAKVESLNAAVACSIVLFEALRQRGGA